MTREKMYNELVHYVDGSYLEKLTITQLQKLYFEILGGL